MLPRYHTRTAGQHAVDHFRTRFYDFAPCDVLVMGPENGWHECKNANGAPIDAGQASRLVDDRIVMLLTAKEGSYYQAGSTIADVVV